MCEHNNVVREKEIGYYQIEYRQMKVGRGKGYQGRSSEPHGRITGQGLLKERGTASLGWAGKNYVHECIVVTNR